MPLYKHTDGKLLYVNNKLAHNNNCCCGLFVACYCPTKTNPTCISGITTEELADLNYYPYIMNNSANRTCENSSDGSDGNDTFRCIGYSNGTGSQGGACFDVGGITCPQSGQIIFTGPEVSNQSLLNCNQYITYGQNTLGTCRGYDSVTNEYLGKYCSTSEEFCDSLAIDYSVTTVWILGTCQEIFDVNIETITNPDTETYEELCSERNCCDSDNCDDPIFCSCSTWRIEEVGPSGGGGHLYQSGNTLANIPATFKPTTGPSNGGWAYTGYMQLRITCKGVTRIAESWTTINGSTHTLGTYGANCVDKVSFTASPIVYVEYSPDKVSSSSGPPF